MEVEAKMRCVGAGALLYMGDVTIDGMITLHGCKLLCVSDKMVCALPAIKTSGGWERPVRLPPSAIRYGGGAEGDARGSQRSAANKERVHL